MFRPRFLLGILTLCLWASLPVSAQDPEEPDQVLSKKESRKRVDRAEEFLKEAKLARDRNDLPGMERALENYVHNMNQLERAIDGWRVPPDERKEVAEVIALATSRHADVLMELGNKVGGQAGVDWALEEAIMQLVFCNLAWQQGFPDLASMRSDSEP